MCGIMFRRVSGIGETAFMESETKRFTMDGQHKFAALSGDFNPIHVDFIAARRLLFGQPVVHGIHTLLWMLDRWLAEGSPIRIRTVRAEFRSPTRLEQDVYCSIRSTGVGQVHLEAATATTRLVTAEIHWQASGGTTNIPGTSPDVETPHALLGSEITSAIGTVPLMFDKNLAGAMFPNVSAKLPADQFAALLASTRVVGMRVPGLHSLLNAIDLADSPDSSSEFSYSVEEYDERFARAILRLRGAGLAGTATAFLRPAPTAQAGFLEVSRSVTRGEFTGERAIVIGGSRGLGEIAVKQLVAGGAAVRFSYHLGEADARRLTHEVTSAGGQADCFQLDVRGETKTLDEVCREFAPTMLCYFSTPSILGAPRGRFSAPLFHELCQFYVDGFLKAFASAASCGSLTRVLQPSSVAIEQTPSGMAEYSAAKAAAETVIRALRISHPKIHFFAPRWGRMPTDLTATIAAADVDDPVPVVLAALREMKNNSPSS